MAATVVFSPVAVHFALFLLLLGCSTNSAAEEETLLMVQILYRHGDRSPTRTFPTNPLPESAWPQGFGQLTQRGMHQHYTVGQFLRNRYIEGHPYKLLNASYNRHEIKLRSTDYDRTLMSAYANLAGLYPPSGSQIWNKDLSWQPIPVHTVLLETDNLLSMDADCPKYDELYEKALNSPDIQKEEKENKEFYKILANKTGNDIEDLTVAWAIHDPIFCARSHGLKEPEWANMTWKNVTIFNKLVELNSLQYDVQFNREGEGRLRGGPLLGEMIRHMQLKISNATQFKSYVYSAHDSTVGALLSTMKVFNRVAPPYTATVIVELIKIKEDHVVRIFYRNDSTKNPYPLTVPGCTVDCSFDEFHRLLKNNIPGDWKAECQSKISSNYSWWLVSGVFILIVSVVLVLTGVFVLRRRKKYRSYRTLKEREENSA